MRHWRELWRKLHEAGYDVLALDRRGIGISGGYSDTNTLQQGRDLLTIVESLRTGEGMRALAADGRLSTGMTAAEALAGGPAGDRQRGGSGTGGSRDVGPGGWP